MSQAERRARKRKRRPVAADSRPSGYSPEQDWFSPTQASLGLNRSNDHSAQPGTSSTKQRRADRRRASSSSVEGDGPEHNAAAIEWEHRRLQSKTSNGLSAHDKGEWEGGTGFVIWDEEEMLDNVHLSRDDNDMQHALSSPQNTSEDESSGSLRASREQSRQPSMHLDSEEKSSGDEAEDKVQKHIRLLENAREARLQALGPEESEEAPQDAWGGSDEEPPDAVLELMTRTAAHLQSATDAAQLIARILANHGGDTRFAFLRGRWHRAWATARAKARVKVEADANAEATKSRTESEAKGGLFGLTAYDDSDENSDDEDAERVVNEEAGDESESISPPYRTEDATEAAKMEMRRQKAREWVAKRRAEQ